MRQTESFVASVEHNYKCPSGHTKVMENSNDSKSLEYPEGFQDLVGMVAKDPLPTLKGKEIWHAFCRSALIGKGRSDAEIHFLMNMLKQYLDYDYVLKTEGEEWEKNVKTFLGERLQRIKDENIQLAVAELLKGLFYTTATLKGGARMFKKRSLFETIDSLTETKEKTRKFIEEIVEDGDVSGMRYTKVILWLQYSGRAKEFAPPTRHLKSFINSDMGPYYSYYEDDDYFMKKADVMTADFSASLLDIYRAIFFYRTLKALLPRGSKLTPKKIVNFLKKSKISVNRLSTMLSDMEQREGLSEKLFRFMGYSRS